MEESYRNGLAEVDVILNYADIEDDKAELQKREDEKREKYNYDSLFKKA